MKPTHKTCFALLAILTGFLALHGYSSVPITNMLMVRILINIKPSPGRHMMCMRSMIPFSTLTAWISVSPDLLVT
jgi:hypothetical protein